MFTPARYFRSSGRMRLLLIAVGLLVPGLSALCLGQHGKAARIFCERAKRQLCDVVAVLGDTLRDESQTETDLLWATVVDHLRGLSLG